MSGYFITYVFLIMQLPHQSYKISIYMYYQMFVKGSGCLMDKVSASQSRDRGFEPHTGHDHDSLDDTSTGGFQEADSRVI